MGTTTPYDAIGRTYASARVADPRLAAVLLDVGYRIVISTDA